MTTRVCPPATFHFYDPNYGQAGFSVSGNLPDEDLSHIPTSRALVHDFVINRHFRYGEKNAMPFIPGLRMRK
jgi:hypothetical protein